MLLSMTGFGEVALPARRPGRGGRSPHDQQPLLQAVSVRTSEGYALAGAADRGGRARVASAAARSRSTSASIADARRTSYQINAAVLDALPAAA